MEEDYKILIKDLPRQEARKTMEEDTRRYVAENAKPCRFCGKVPKVKMAMMDADTVELKCECGFGRSRVGSRVGAVEGWNKMQDDEEYYIMFYKADSKFVRIDFDTSEEAKEFYMSFILNCKNGIGYRNEFYPKKDITMAKLYIPFKNMDSFMQKGKWVI